jgi:hypothetical protein
LKTSVGPITETLRVLTVLCSPTVGGLITWGVSSSLGFLNMTFSCFPGFQSGDSLNGLEYSRVPFVARRALAADLRAEERY